MPDSFFAELYHDTEALNWDPVDQVRARARRRTRQTRLVAGLASVVAVAVVASGAVALAEGREPVPPAPPATNSSLASPGIPTAAMLRYEDLVGVFGPTLIEPGIAWYFDMETSRTCEGDEQSWPEANAFREDGFIQTYDYYLFERVERHSEEAAKTMMENVRREVAGCKPRDPDSSKGMEVFASDLAGDESLLVGRTGDLTSRWLFVRQGELVAQVGIKGIDPAEDQRIAERTAARLCASIDAAC
ncbi:hypothetical protein [Salinispora oceanensis]|uniref:hypothetical protein n=2 Tax=Salinispora oceanensis TaxID=1050199 RepID=UPI00039EAD3E|nr:hypothetical protein [Salinispora oceanensis]